MRKVFSYSKNIFLSLVLFGLGGILFFSCQKTIPSDTIFYNGKIFTAVSDSQFVSALAVKNGKILATGSDEEILSRYKSEKTRMVDLQKRLVVPGFHDAHLHFWNGAKTRSEINLIGVTSLKEIIARIEAAVAKAPPGTWITGRGWDNELWSDKKMPDRKILDRISRKHLIYLKRVDGHAAWVNTPVLQLLRYNRSTPDPPGGKIVRDKRTGEPTGILIDAAFQLLDKIIPEPTFTEKYAKIKETLKYANRLGITSITDNSPLDIYRVYAELLNRGELTLRVNFWANYGANLDSIRQVIRKYGQKKEFLNLRLIKLYADGALGSRGAYLKAPYLDDPGNYGLQRHPFNELYEMVLNADQAGFQIGIHAIGDAAISEVLDVYEKLAVEYPRGDRRWRIEHSQIMDSSDFKRYQELGVIASMQPSHAITDMHWAPRRIGDRVRYAYAWRSFLDHQVQLAFGTDWPVEPLNPMIGIYAAITRQDTTGYPPQGWYPEERLSVGEAIRAYTFGSAFAAKNESWSGTLQMGRVADFVILDRDIFQVPPAEVLQTRVIATYLNGEPVYQQD